MLAAIYVVGMAVVAVAVHVLLRRDRRERRPSEWVWTVASAVLWPLLVVGAIEIAVLVVAIEQLRRRRARALTETVELSEDLLLVK